MKVQLIKLLGLTALISIVSCGVKQETFTNAELRIEKLKTSGIQDSTLSTAKVLLYQGQDALKRNNMNLAAKSAKSLKRELASIEATFKDNNDRLLPVIDSLRSVIRATRSGLTGLQLKKLDSLMVPVDSFLNKKWVLEAYSKAKEVGARIPEFNKDEAAAKALRTTLPGEWVCTNETKNTEQKDIHAIEKKIFTFNRDGKVLLDEHKSGKSGPYLKEDWAFKSYGTWDLHGDTVHLFINRFASIRQNFERMYIEPDGKGGKKKIWKKEPQPTYDSTITDGSQDRYVAYEDLKSDFIQTKKF